MGVETLKERTKWAIDYIVKKEHLSNVKLAKRMEIAAGTINTYRRMVTVPNIEFVIKFCEMFHFSLLWFIQGIGYPFPVAWETNPESKGPALCAKPEDIVGLFGPNSGTGSVPAKNPEVYSKESSPSDAYTGNTADYHTNDSLPAASKEIRLSEALTMAARVLESGTSYAAALYLNIQQLDRIIANESRIAQVVPKQCALGAKIYERLQELEKEIERFI